MKYESPPVRLTPLMPLTVTRAQQPGKVWLLDRLPQEAFATSAPGRPALSVQMLAKNVLVPVTIPTPRSNDVTLKLPLPPTVNRLASLMVLPVPPAVPLIVHPDVPL